jgi:hypothetical protein
MDTKWVRLGVREFQATRKWLEAFMTEAVNELENSAV